MINKGQKKRVLSESDGIGKSQDTNKNVQPLKKIKNIKQELGVGAEVQKNEAKKVVKSKTDGAVQNASLPLNQQVSKKAKELKAKKTVLVNSKKVNLKYKLIKGEKEDKSAAKELTKSIKQELKKGQKEKGQQKVENGGLSVEEKIAEIKSRGNLTKTSKRKLNILQKKLAIQNGLPLPRREIVSNNTPRISKSQSRKLRKKLAAERYLQNKTQNDVTKKSKNEEKPVNIQKSKKKVPQPGDKSVVKQTQHENAKTLGPVKSEPIEKQSGKRATKVVQVNKQNGKSKVQIMMQNKGGNKKQSRKGAFPEIKIKKEIKQEEDDSEDDDEDENENADNTLNSSLNTSVDNDDDEDDDDDDDEDDDDDDDEEEEDDDDDDDDDDDEEEEDENVKSEKPQAKKPQQEDSIKKSTNLQKLNGPEKKKRYVIFVGNLPYDATTEDVKKHFLAKVSEVISVRIPTKTGSNTSRGIGYVELSNDKDYEKALSLHNTTINGRRINVEYTKTGSKNVRNNKDVVAKNKKLHALRKAGVLAGSQKHDQKRSVRRAKHIKPN